MLAGVGTALVHGLAAVGAVVEQLIEVAFLKQAAGLAGNALGSKPAHRLGAGIRFGEQREHTSHPRRFCLIDHELPIANTNSRAALFRPSTFRAPGLRRICRESVRRSPRARIERS